MRTRTTIHDVRTVFVRSKGPNDFMVSALMAICGVGPRRKTKPNRKRTMSPIATIRPRLSPMYQIPLVVMAFSALPAGEGRPLPAPGRAPRTGPRWRRGVPYPATRPVADHRPRHQRCIALCRTQCQSASPSEAGGSSRRPAPSEATSPFAHFITTGHYNPTPARGRQARFRRAHALPFAQKPQAVKPEARRREAPPLLRLEVLQVQPLDHVPERRELLQFLRPRLAGRLYLPGAVLLQRLPLLVQAHARLLQHRLLGADRHLGAYRQGDGVAGARVDLQALPVHVQGDAGEERVVRQIAHEDVGHSRAEAVDDGTEQVVGEGPGHGNLLESHGDRVRLSRPDPDRQVAVGFLLFENHHPLVVHQADTDALYRELDHTPTSGFQCTAILAQPTRGVNRTGYAVRRALRRVDVVRQAAHADTGVGEQQEEDGDAEEDGGNAGEVSYGADDQQGKQGYE